MNRDIRVYTKGNAFQEGVYDLRSLELIINSYRSILDRLIAVQLGRRQLTSTIKNQIDYQVQVNSGSLELLIDFVFQHKEIFAVLAADGGYQLSEIIVKLLRDAIHLRIEAAKFIEKGIKFDIKIVNSFNVGGGNVNTNLEEREIQIIDPRILWAAQVTKYPADRLITRIDGDYIQYIEIGSQGEEFRVTPEDRKIVGNKQEKLPTTLKVIGRLDMIAFTSHRGVIISDREKFPVTWNEDIRSKLQKVADIEGVIFTVEPIIDRKKLHDNAIAFHVLDCLGPQQEMII